MRTLYGTLIFAIIPFTAMADGTTTPCASRAFSDALVANSANISETDTPEMVQEWIKKTMMDNATLTRVLACPEITSVPDDSAIKFDPIQFVFPSGRNIIINYETNPRVLAQRLSLSNRRRTPTNGTINPMDDDAIWTNTDPAWYGILVVESGTLSEFVGPDRNNIVPLTYIYDNIDSLYPQNSTCTSRSALATDDDAINRAAHQTVNIPDDTNDYYVAGDINLQWIAYAEIALDVVLTVATMGGSTAITGATKSARASRTLKQMSTTMRELGHTTDVVKYLDATRDAARMADAIRDLDRVQDAAKIADMTKDLDKINDTIRTLESMDDVKKYRDMTRAYNELNQWRRNLRAIKIPQRGNIVARMARSAHAATTGNKQIAAAAKFARSGGTAARLRDWLFDKTLRNIGILGQVGRHTGMAYGAIKFVGNMYDWTETSTGEYTSNVDFSPLLLLSADDLAGQENVVNHGMWLTWMGDSTDPNDDDAAYLQAMDFAAKFHQDLTAVQGDTATPCNVDIFIVRPILRNPGTANPELYYLVMNDVPWTTSTID